MTTIAHLSQAISAFEGVVVLVSHNRDLIMALGEDVELWEVGGGRVKKFPGTIDGFKGRVRGQMAGGATAARGLDIGYDDRFQMSSDPINTAGF